ncbi:hypothetical protein KX816_14195 [Sphingosinicellaceae bacterium]|nr:hypothetical protein KX816_14195 [Sphingosinicellaceae bacterium]
MQIWNSQGFDAHKQVCLFDGAPTVLGASVAVRLTALGKAAGGTRFKRCLSAAVAIDEALSQSRALSNKAAAIVGQRPADIVRRAEGLPVEVIAQQSACELGRVPAAKTG